MQPSLPQNAGAAANSHQNNPYQQGVNPYPNYYNSHYLQAYAQPTPSVNYSSSQSACFPPRTNNLQGTSKSLPTPSSSSWYQHGNHRCTYNGCAFTGSAKSVELHMMDRHLIYPPGWDKQKKKPEWDADPSLKGKPIPIQGTNVILDSPEVLAAWIEERKRRFPTSSRVDDKKRKMEEAVARGQLDLSETALRASKRRKTESSNPAEHSRKRTAGNALNHSASGSSSTIDRVPDSGWGARSKVKDVQAALPIISPPSPDESSEDDDDQPPEVVSSKVGPPIDETPVAIKPSNDEMKREVPTGKHENVGSQRKHRPTQPKMAPRNPFAARPKLLRNLLLPEIRVTVSNLSQAIRFLVDNDFLKDVELKPGQALEKNKIQIVHREEET